MLSSTFSLWCPHRFFCGCRSLKCVHWTRGHITMHGYMLVFACISPSSHKANLSADFKNKAKIPFLHFICTCWLSMFWPVHLFFFFFSPYNMCFSAMNSTSPLLLSICLMVSYAVLAVANFLTGFPSCFLSKELCFGMGQEVVFKLTAFCSLLICTLGHALLLRVIWISL